MSNIADSGIWRNIFASLNFVGDAVLANKSQCVKASHTSDFGARIANGEPVSPLAAWGVCPFRSLFGPPGTPDEMMARVSGIFVALGDDAEIEPDLFGELVDSLNAGGTLLLMSDRRETRDAIKRSFAMLVPHAVGGQA